MKTAWKALLLTLASTILIFSIIFMVALKKLSSIWQPVISTTNIHIPALNESVYIRKKLWGITHDHKVIWISSQPDENAEHDPNTNYIYKGSSPLFYRITDEGLEIYTMKASPIPPGFESSVKIVQIELDNPDMMELLKNYNRKGLKKLE